MPAFARTRLVRAILLLFVLVISIAGWWIAANGGRYLQHEDRLQHADAICVLGGTRAERPLEAFSLFQEGWASFIVLSPEHPEPAEVFLQQHGIRFPAESEVQQSALIQLGVPADHVIAPSGSVDNTAAEAQWFKRIARARGWHRLIIVTSKMHTRRAGFAFRREFANTGIEILIRASRYDHADPAGWIHHRDDLRFGLSEWEKLIAYRFGLGS